MQTLLPNTRGKAQTRFLQNVASKRLMILALCVLFTLSFSTSNGQCTKLSGSYIFDDPLHPTITTFEWTYLPVGLVIDKDVYIPNGDTVNLHGLTVSFAPGVHIYVDGLLNIYYDAVLTNACSNHSWGGIVANSATAGGHVNFYPGTTSGATVQNAEIGLDLSSPTTSTYFSAASAYKTTFLNCQTDVLITNHSNNAPNYFTQCTFKATQAAYDIGTDYDVANGTFVDLNNNTASTIFEGCTFENLVSRSDYISTSWASIYGIYPPDLYTLPGESSRSIGIRAINSTLMVKEKNLCGTEVIGSPNACPATCDAFYRSKFNYFYRAIDIEDDNTHKGSVTADIRYSDFNENFQGVYAYNTDKTLITQCNYTITDDASVSDNYQVYALKLPETGRSSIYMEDCSGMEVSNCNFQFVETANSGGYTAIDLRNSGSDPSWIHNNSTNMRVQDPPSSYQYTFTGLSTIGNNGGMKINCNGFHDVPEDASGNPWPGGENENIYDWFIGADVETGELVLPNQGSTANGMGNSFTNFVPYSGQTEVTPYNIFVFNLGTPFNITLYDCPTCGYNFPGLMGGDATGIVYSTLPTTVDCTQGNCSHFERQLPNPPPPSMPFVIVNGSDENQPASLQLYPNPASELLTVDYALGKDENPVQISAEILDATGRTVIRRQLNAPKGKETFDVSHLARGIYMLRLNTDGKRRFQEKFVVN
jgi:hypothetical protein